MTGGRELRVDWIYKYFSLTAIIVSIGILIRYLIQKKIDSYFNTKLESHKQELNQINEKVKYDITKKLFDFEAYATKKHDIYPELYQKIYIIFGKLRNLQGIIMGLFHITEVKVYQLNLPGNEYLIEEKDSLRNVEVEYLTSVHEYINQNILFLSDNVAKTSKEVLNQANMILACFHVNEYDWDFVEEEFGDLQRKISKLKDALYKELSYSHFEE
jgi:hypothetical protein